MRELARTLKPCAYSNESICVSRRTMTPKDVHTCMSQIVRTGGRASCWQIRCVDGRRRVCGTVQRPQSEISEIVISSATKLF